MRLWLDDVRPAPDGYIWVKDFASFLILVDTCLIEHISFDHDLGDILTGYDCAKLIEKRAYQGKLPRLTWSIHTANPSGEINIRSALMQADKFWEKG